MTSRETAEEHEKSQRRGELADFLRTRRARLTPEQVGLPRRGRRRTPGLRREEVAELIGVGITWYTWLEQGRPINVSTEVLENLARILRLSMDERIHLFLLAGRALPAERGLAQGTVSSEQRTLLAALEPYPAHVRDQHWYVLAWNRAENLVAQWDHLPPTERHVLWNHFTNQGLRQLAVDWEGDAQTLLALFRMQVGQDAGEPQLAALIARLQRISPEFRRWWPQHQVRAQRERPIELVHPDVGRLLLKRVTLTFEPERLFVARVLLPAPPSQSETATRLRQLLDEQE